MNEIFYRTAGKMLVMIMHDADQYRSRFDKVIEPKVTNDRGEEACEPEVVRS